ncbi:MAG TPA: hypothetical protein PLU72_06705 [Candidatus Ozemobacteraceae bacterium]|nr:hypothetical protein [Candidatus Ozemobacteraceae bacterium]HQG27287.1 hypothetical protein [Candidatus Ozemobacteraceae bacterium]
MIPYGISFPRTPYLASLLALFLVVAGVLPLTAASRNLLPRLPEFVLERGHSDAFQVVECEAKSRLLDETAESTVRITLKNVSDKQVESSLKIRILYLTGDAAAQLEVNGRPVRYDRANPRLPFSLAPGQEISLLLKARHGIQYSLEAANREQREQQSALQDAAPKKRGFALDDLRSLFDNEKFGKRFMVGPLISKWGIFPVDFRNVKISIVAPSDFDAILPDPAHWQSRRDSRNTTFTFEGTDGFAAAIFLPSVDAEQFRQARSEAASAPVTP